MTPITRSAMLALTAAASLISWSELATAADATKLKLVLNWKYQGPQGLFFLADDRGYFKSEGIDLTIDQGSGSGAAPVLVANGTYDAGFGDINALIELAGKKPEDAPIAVYVMYNQPPFTVAVKAESSIKSPKDFEGKTLGGAAGDGALKLFPALCQITKIDCSEGEYHQYATELARADADAGPGRRGVRLRQHDSFLGAADRRRGQANPLRQLRRLRHGSLFQCDYRLEEARRRRSRRP